MDKRAQMAENRTHMAKNGTLTAEDRGGGKIKSKLTASLGCREAQFPHSLYSIGYRDTQGPNSLYPIVQSLFFGYWAL